MRHVSFGGYSRRGCAVQPQAPLSPDCIAKAFLIDALCFNSYEWRLLVRDAGFIQTHAGPTRQVELHSKTC